MFVLNTACFYVSTVLEVCWHHHLAFTALTHVCAVLLPVWINTVDEVFKTSGLLTMPFLLPGPITFVNRPMVIWWLVACYLNKLFIFLDNNKTCLLLLLEERTYNIETLENTRITQLLSGVAEMGSELRTTLLINLYRLHLCGFQIVNTVLLLKTGLCLKEGDNYKIAIVVHHTLMKKCSIILTLGED